jgi:hypothetical protein
VSRYTVVTAGRTGPGADQSRSVAPIGVGAAMKGSPTPARALNLTSLLRPVMLVTGRKTRAQSVVLMQHSRWTSLGSWNDWPGYVS